MGRIQKGMKAVEAEKLAITTEGAKVFDLYSNRLFDKHWQPWEKIIKAQVTSAPWEDIYEVTQSRLPLKRGTPFVSASHVTFDGCSNMK